jgi:hypothetical protein
VTEEVEGERTVGLGTELRDLLSHLLGRKHSAWQRPERAAFYCCDGKLDAGRSGHRSLNDRLLGTDELEDAAV